MTIPGHVTVFAVKASRARLTRCRRIVAVVARTLAGSGRAHTVRNKCRLCWGRQHSALALFVENVPSQMALPASTAGSTGTSDVALAFLAESPLSVPSTHPAAQWFGSLGQEVSRDALRRGQ